MQERRETLAAFLFVKHPNDPTPYCCNPPKENLPRTVGAGLARESDLQGNAGLKGPFAGKPGSYST